MSLFPRCSIAFCLFYIAATSTAVQGQCLNEPFVREFAFDWGVNCSGGLKVIPVGSFCPLLCPTNGRFSRARSFVPQLDTAAGVLVECTCWNFTADGNCTQAEWENSGGCSDPNDNNPTFPAATEAPGPLTFTFSEVPVFTTVAPETIAPETVFQSTEMPVAQSTGDNSGFSLGVVIGAALGSVFLAVLLVLAIFRFWLKKSRGTSPVENSRDQFVSSESG
eukprot:791088_1